MRNTLNYNSLPEVIQSMIESSSNAASIIDELIESKGESNILAILIMLDDMNIRGVQISALYKMCDQDINKFYDKVLSINEKDIEDLNLETFAICKFKALYQGSAQDREKNIDKYIFTDEERNAIRNRKNKDLAQDIIKDSIPKNDLYPSIRTKEALEIIEKQGFKCGFKKTYENKDGVDETYRVFYNDKNDIMYTHSLEDIFLWGESKLNIVRKSDHQNLELIGCNTYMNVEGVVGYNIELKEKPFETYKKVLEKKEKELDEINTEYYDSNLIPIIESLEGIKYRNTHSGYNSSVIAGIYDLLTFPETFCDMDNTLKKIYTKLLDNAEIKAYDQIIYQLNTDEGINIIKELQNVLGIKLNKEKLMKAKERFCKKNNDKFEKPKRGLFGYLKEKPADKKIEKRISLVLSKEIAYIN